VSQRRCTSIFVCSRSRLRNRSRRREIQNLASFFYLGTWHSSGGSLAGPTIPLSPQFQPYVDALSISFLRASGSITRLGLGERHCLNLPQLRWRETEYGHPTGRTKILTRTGRDEQHEYGSLFQLGPCPNEWVHIASPVIAKPEQLRGYGAHLQIPLLDFAHYPIEPEGRLQTARTQLFHYDADGPSWPLIYTRQGQDGEMFLVDPGLESAPCNPTTYPTIKAASITVPCQPSMARKQRKVSISPMNRGRYR
jgi:hypothetical protein